MLMKALVRSRGVRTYWSLVSVGKLYIKHVFHKEPMSLVTTCTT